MLGGRVVCRLAPQTRGLLRQAAALRGFADKKSPATEAAIHRSAITQELWSLRRGGANGPVPPSADGTRTPSQTRVAVRYEFSTDEELRARYESAFGTMRMGVLLEDMDAIAGSVAWRHVDDDDPSTDPPMLVTASVDAIEVNEELSLNHDYVLVGSMVWTGRTSLEIAVKLRSVHPPGEEHKDREALGGVFTFVARSADGAKSQAVPQLVPETPQEIECHTKAANKQAALKAARASGDDKKQENREVEEKAIAKHLAEARVASDFPGLADDGVVPMSRTGLRHASLCHPQERNTAGRVFGGVLMRRALELAYATAYAFGGAAPRLRALDRVEFLRPVDVGALLALKSTVVLCEKGNGGEEYSGIVHVLVAAAAWRPAVRSSEMTNTFTFVFNLQGANRPLKTVQPARSSEVRLQLRAKRRFAEVASSSS